MGGPSEVHTTSTNKVELPKWVEDASQSNYNLATDIANKPLEQYQGSVVADASPMTTMAQQLAMSGAGVNPMRTQAASMFSQLGNSTITPREVTAGKVSDSDISRYMNPMLDTVVNNAMGDLDHSRQLSLQGNADKAIAAKAFGGSRSGIVDAVTNAETARAAGTVSGQLRSDAYNTALGAATGDVNRTFQADTTNSASDMQAQLSRLQSLATGASGLNSTADGVQTKNNSDIASLMQLGMQDRAHSQQEIDANVAKFNEARDYDKEGLNLRLASLGMSPYGRTESGSKTETKQDPFDFGSLGLGIFSTLMGLSDDNEKTDKKKLGKLPNTNLDLWAFRYKGDPKTYPKSVGLMASQVEKAMPKAVTKIAGRRVVNYGMIKEAANRGK